MRFSVSGAKGRFVFTGLTKFPIIKDDNFAMFACFSNTTDWFTNFNGKVTLTLEDKNGNIIASDTYSGVITPKIMAIKKDLIAKHNYDELYLKATISDSHGDVYQTITKPYRLSDFFREPSVIEKYNNSKKAEETPAQTSTPAKPSKTPQKISPKPTSAKPSKTPARLSKGIPFIYIVLAGAVTLLLIGAFLYYMKERGR